MADFHSDLNFVIQSKLILMKINSIRKTNYSYLKPGQFLCIKSALQGDTLGILGVTSPDLVNSHSSLTGRILPVWIRKPGTNSSTKTGDFKLCRETRDYNLTKWALSLDNNADLLWVWL